MRISDWSSDVCSSDLDEARRLVAVLGPHSRDADDDDAMEMTRDGQIVGRPARLAAQPLEREYRDALQRLGHVQRPPAADVEVERGNVRAVLRRIVGEAEERSEEHTSELQSLMR